MLCDLGADFDLSDNEGNTALHQYVSSVFMHGSLVTLCPPARAPGDTFPCVAISDLDCVVED